MFLSEFELLVKIEMLREYSILRSGVVNHGKKGDDGNGRRRDGKEENSKEDGIEGIAICSVV